MWWRIHRPEPSNILQFLKFQEFAAQLTKETQDLKVKIETHKRENRRLTLLIDQQKDDAARLTVRLSGTEKQRDDALEALVLQQEIAEELERERKRNMKELSALQHMNTSISRQRDESQRVVLHLRSLINGQTHHMEHIIRSLNQTSEVSNYVSEGFEDTPDELDDRVSVASSENPKTPKHLARLRTDLRRPYSSTSNYDSDGKAEGEHVTPEMENRFFSSILGEKSGRASRLSMADVADRHLRDKTDAIADIIRNISEQCAAAVEGLQLAHHADQDDDVLEGKKVHDENLAPSDDGHDHSIRTDGSDMGEVEESSFLSPDSHNSSIPPTPDLVHNRSSTSMSMVSTSIASDRSSQHYHNHPDMVTKIVENEDEDERRSEASTGMPESGKAKLTRVDAGGLSRPVTARIVQ